MKLFCLGRRKGFALLLVLVMIGVAALLAGSTMKRTYTVSMLNQRAKQHQSAMYAAEAAAEKVYSRMRHDYLTGGDAALSNGLYTATYENLVPTAAENSFWNNFEFSDAQGNNGKTYVEKITEKTYQVLDGNYRGLNGWRAIYRIVSNARSLNGMYPVSAGVQQDIAVDTIPAFQFVIFYNSQLEFTQCAPLTNRGRVHANGPICLGAPSGSPNTLVFGGTVTTTSTILNSNLGGYTSFSAPIYLGNPQRTTGVPTLKLPIGTNDNSAASVRKIIELPAGESATSALGQQRYYNKAGVVLLISNTSVRTIVKDLGAGSGTVSTLAYNSASPSAVERTNLNLLLPFLSLTNRFYDYRESKWVMPTQIDMGRLQRWLLTNNVVTNEFPIASEQFPNIMYVADFRDLTNLHAVRLTNGIVIPTNAPIAGTNIGLATGFTLATINPLYVWGNYNSPNSAHLGTTNTTQAFPASLVADAITVLSANWQDSTYGNAGHATYGTSGLGNRDAANTTVNAAIIAGAVYSTGTTAGTWSGGVHNLTRLLEDWGGRRLTLNTSLVNLYDSVRANTQFKNPGNYYNAPTRNFNFDQNYLSAAKLPPGTPTVSVISRALWTLTPINTVTYNGP